MPEVEIDIDDLLEVTSDDERASKLQVHHHYGSNYKNKAKSSLFSQTFSKSASLPFLTVCWISLFTAVDGAAVKPPQPGGLSVWNCT